MKYIAIKKLEWLIDSFLSRAINTIRFLTSFLLVFSFSCNRSPDIPVYSANWSISESASPRVKGALLSTNFNSFEELKKVVQIEYFNTNPGSGVFQNKKSSVRLTHHSNGTTVISFLESGVSDKDFAKARDGSLWKKVFVGLSSPYVVRHRKDFMRVHIMARKNFKAFGEGGVAFYQLAKTMLYNIQEDDLASISSIDLSEKGYINTFNHITAQVIITALFSEKFADFIADAHERGNMPELTTGMFTEDQLSDLETGPIDNYVDMINNEWGQELGKVLKKKYNVSRETYWTPELLSNFLNDIQSYYSWAFQISFKPFKPEDETVKKFSKRINKVMGDLSEF